MYSLQRTPVIFIYSLQCTRIIFLTIHNVFFIMTPCELYEVGTDFPYVLLINVSFQRVDIGFMASLEGMNIRMKP